MTGCSTFLGWCRPHEMVSMDFSWNLKMHFKSRPDTTWTSSKHPWQRTKWQQRKPWLDISMHILFYDALIFFISPIFSSFHLMTFVLAATINFISFFWVLHVFLNQSSNRYMYPSAQLLLPNKFITSHGTPGCGIWTQHVKPLIYMFRKMISSPMV